ncbi:MAG: hypothetical protein AW07_03610 [Candidatus Accumulibacter sp. SK-11]|nr:MAG: hypothetical protein AW07_03610 [Candidatus Accumulibacter sp. SK-11]
MPIRPGLWKVSATPQPLPEAQLANERKLEDMIVAAPKLLSDEWMLIGRQEDTGFGGRIDLLAIAPDGALVPDRTQARQDAARRRRPIAGLRQLGRETPRRGHRRHLRPLRPQPESRRGLPATLRPGARRGLAQREPPDHHRRVLARRQHRAHRRLPQRARHPDQPPLLPGLRQRQ